MKKTTWKKKKKRERQTKSTEITLNPLPPTEIHQALKDAKLQLKKSQRKDYYKILGVEKDCSDDDVRKAYRKMALKYHPGRFL